MAEGEYSITIIHTTSGKEITMAVESKFKMMDLFDVLYSTLQLKDRFVLANEKNEIINPEMTLEEAGVKAGSKLLLMPDPTGG